MEKEYKELNYELRLDKVEAEIINTLVEFVEKAELKTTLRIVGGWVRDKVNLLDIL